MIKKKSELNGMNTTLAINSHADALIRCGQNKNYKTYILNIPPPPHG